MRILFGYERAQVTTYYGLFVLGIVLYVGSNALGYIDGIIPPALAEKIGWVGATFITSFFLAFTYCFPYRQKSLGELLPLVLWPLAIFVPAFLFTDIFILRSIEINYGQGYQVPAGHYLWFFFIFYGFYWLWSWRNLIIRYRKSDGIHRWQLRNILIGVGSSMVVSTSFDIILPSFTASRFGYIGSVFSAVWLGFTSYIILKK